MKLDEKGFGIIQSILLCAFLVFLIIPVFSVLTEKVYIKYSIHKVNEIADMAVMSSVFGIDPGKFSEKKLIFGDEEELEAIVYGCIGANGISGMEITEFDMSVHEKGGYCDCGGSSSYDFIHLLMKISLERYGNRGVVEFYIHRDIEFPYGR
ncbi:MAG: hypothetical protein JXB33_01135 [Clostridia bacterium]|nr:hypothetical protein [Clostridia bacterium]